MAKGMTIWTSCALVMGVLSGCGGLHWPDDPKDYELVGASYIGELTAPEKDGKTYDCCRDFGEISRDFLEENAYGTDNAVAGLFDSLAIITGLTFQGQLDANVETGQLALVLDHAGYKKDGKPFTLVAHQARFAAGTTWDSAKDGGGHFELMETNFQTGTGTPRWQFPEAVVDRNGVLNAEKGEVVWALSILDVGFDARIRDVRLTARRRDGTGEVFYDNGSFSGYVTTEDFFLGLNAKIDAECGCLGVTEPVYYLGDDGNWTSRCIADATARCPDPAHEQCPDLAGSDQAVNLCTMIPGVITDTADIDLDGDPTTFEAASVGLRWKSVPAVVD